MDSFATRWLRQSREKPHDEGESHQETTGSEPSLEEPTYTGEDEDKQPGGVSFTALLAQASLTWTESSEPAPSRPDYTDYEHVEYGTTELVLAPEIVERERRPYAFNFHHLYTMIPTGRSLRFAMCEFEYWVNCSGD
ncbi:hypothetical protein G7Z17_g10469 [Cylindrodendrum hubeiense]|uniref:Uncharacterized protein n=1 Tax=Cylindrodendrum hubeiense TaxID=595255 RepID=A0A9P5L783_9HYPO|nr:hypothetical protein G7Z17_g10469 [Cylindrodendrum hubeiense]